MFCELSIHARSHGRLAVSLSSRGVVQKVCRVVKARLPFTPSSVSVSSVRVSFIHVRSVAAAAAAARSNVWQHGRAADHIVMQINLSA